QTGMVSYLPDHALPKRSELRINRA
ncbi:uncharacterized protein METZ01_LOCUS422094, partial [marine metagenome]